jgi:hypothetical protein
MMDEGAAGALAAALSAVLAQVPGLSGAFDGAPIAAGDPHAVVEMGPEVDWGHKSGAGSELRFAVLIRCGGEEAGPARRLAAAARERVAAVEPELQGWRLVSLAMMRARTLREPGPRWTAVVEYRARMLRKVE